jgi:hypothetical protein
MSTDTILKKILNNVNLKAKYWPDVNVDKMNLKTIAVQDNIYLKYIAAMLSDASSEQVRKNQIANLLN